jgi:hypothetical protein
VRPDGAPSRAQMLHDFIATAPGIDAPPVRARIEVDGEAFYHGPAGANRALYQRSKEGR